MGDGRDHVLVRFLMLRLLGLVYLVAFLIAARQIVPLVGEHGLEPAAAFFTRVRDHEHGSAWAVFWDAPTIFHFIRPTDGALLAVSWLGVLLSGAVLLGVENAALMIALWALYFSIVSIGQTFYGFGWESQLLETGLLAAFLCPLRTLRPFAAPPPIIGIWLSRWLIVRIMLGAGLIKMRGDPCWRELTCLVYHYETQPNPSPLSWVLNGMPKWFHELGALFNHAVELGAPLIAFAPRRGRLLAGCLFVAFQSILISSGNLSFLNWLTIVPALACFDDRFLAGLAPKRLKKRCRALKRRVFALPRNPHLTARILAGVYCVVVGYLSIDIVQNLVSPTQSMNRSFDPLRIVNTYGAFGSVGRERDELVIEGTSDETVSVLTKWEEYEFPCKPGAVERHPCLVTPYHYRFDWQIWFAAMSKPARQPWLLHFVQKLLDGDRSVEPLVARDPFPSTPPRWVRIQHYTYRFSKPGDGNSAWWTRELVETWLPPVKAGDAGLAEFLRRRGW